MPLTILYVEDNPLVADTVSDTLTLEGWRVTLCRDGLSALHELQSATHYDLLLLDQDLPHIDGLQLIRHARTLAHRQRTPIIMLSANQCRDEARRVGADIFLQKPEGINHLVLTIMQLLHQGACSPSRTLRGHVFAGRGDCAALAAMSGGVAAKFLNRLSGRVC